MPTTVDQLDLSPLPPASRREIREFYQFLLERRKRKIKPGQSSAARHRFTDLCGQLSWKGDAVAAQRVIRDEW
ncbi:MAG TPA: hypothetical protein DCY86_00015 [Bdellovibrionales bacterium]|jgi:hypothetical protein|nr:hypothetical protein [Bdellovibrionales bacterium]